MTVRYIEVLGHEYRRLRMAMTVRGFRMRCNVHTWRSVGWLFGMLFARSIERAERIGEAMRCRGFTGEFPVLSEIAYTRRDAVFLARLAGRWRCCRRPARGNRMTARARRRCSG